MADEHLISKKELLARYGISYGALYRWKRKGLIPDEWFIKRATVTGQETFFPERLICERVETVLQKKEDVLLDELAQQLSHREEESECLVLATEFGEKSFRLCDVRAVRLVGRDGQSTEVLSLIKSQLQKNK